MTWLTDLKDRLRRDPTNVVYRLELPDGEVLGVIKHGGTVAFARFNRDENRWEISMTTAQRDIITRAWEEEERLKRQQGEVERDRLVRDRARWGPPTQM